MEGPLCVADEFGLNLTNGFGAGILQKPLGRRVFSWFMQEEWGWKKMGYSKGSSLCLQALASTDRDLLVEQETRALQVLMVDIEGME